MTSDPSKLYKKKNYIQLFQIIKGDPGGWERVTFTWLGRINILKMSILPKCLFCYANDTLLSKAFFVNNLHIFPDFLWQKTKPRLAYYTLMTVI